MGDPAEAAFDLVYPRNHKLGLNRPSFFMGGMGLAMRYTPDRLMRDRIVECMGIGRDRKLKLKVEKLEALNIWQAIGPVWLFVFDQPKGTYYEAPLNEWEARCHSFGKRDTFENDGKAYVELHANSFPSQPHQLPEADST
jgi:hypothetical protein